MSRTLAALITNESGVTMIEYGFIALLIATAAVMVLTTIGTSIQGIFTNVSGSF